MGYPQQNLQRRSMSVVKPIFHHHKSAPAEPHVKTFATYGGDSIVCVITVFYRHTPLTAAMVFASIISFFCFGVFFGFCSGFLRGRVKGISMFFSVAMDLLIRCNQISCEGRCLLKNRYHTITIQNNGGDIFMPPPLFYLIFFGD